jgi:hypothetical protein
MLQEATNKQCMHPPLSLSVLPSAWTLFFLCKRNPKMKWNLGFVWSLWVSSSWSSLWEVEFSMLSLLGKFSPENCWKTVFALVLHRKSSNLIIPLWGDHIFRGSLARRNIGGYVMHDCLLLLWSSHLCGHACAAAEYRFLYYDFSLWCNLPWGREAHLLLAKWSSRDK